MFPLNVAQLRAAVSSLEDAARALTADTTQARDRWVRGFAAGLAGEAFRAGEAAEEKLLDTLDASAAVLHKAAHILEVATFQQQRLDFLMRVVLPVAETGLEFNAPATLLLTQLRMAAKNLDAVTAWALHRLDSGDSGFIAQLQDFGDIPAEEIDRINRQRVAPEVTAAVEQLDTEEPVHILEVKDGGLVVAVGDIDSAASVTTVVAGVGSSHPESWGGYLNRAATIQKHTGGAVVLWCGYDAPGNIITGLRDTPALEAATGLREFQQALRDRASIRGDAQKLLVAGHSYGSLVVLTAARGAGLQADAAIAMGSAGGNIHHVSELHLHATDGHCEVYATTGRSDPIGLTGSVFGGLHGADPAGGLFGAQLWPSSQGHSGYWDDESFLQHLAEVANSD